MLTKKQLARILESMETLEDILTAWQGLCGFNDSEAARHVGLGVEHYWRIKHGERSNLRDGTLEKLTLGTGFPGERLVIAAALGKHRRKAAPQHQAEPVTEDEESPRLATA